MTREEYIKICSVCTNRKFSPKEGIICGLTDKPANFELSCPDYEEDSNEVRLVEMKNNHDTKQSNKVVNRARIVLFVVAGLYAFVGVYEAFFMLGAHILFGTIDWIVSAIFIGLAIFSYKKAFLALILGLGVYLGLILLLAVLDPMTIVQGIIWKILIVTLLVLGIKEAKSSKPKEAKTTNGELLDQL
ncbi:MAG: hypothetical protein HWE22_15700 [Flavobacteriales bacterium]|nr:hypothetical protein [Flavobacteriales bacterium]